jgi:hypothetical protein
MAHVLIVGGLALGLLVIGCREADRKPAGTSLRPQATEERTMEPDPPTPGDSEPTPPEVRPLPDPIDDHLFDNVEIGSNEPWPCSPPEPDAPDWLGILIRAPKRVTFKPGQTFGEQKVFAKVPICGFFLFAASASPDASFEPMKCVAKDEKTGKIYSGPIVDLNPGEPAPPPEAPPIAPGDLDGFSSGGYFNINLVDFARIPPGPGRYQVHVEGGRHRSNIVSIEIVRQEEPAKE